MYRFRGEFDGDMDEVTTISDYPTEENKYEVFCRTCNKTLYGDADALNEYNHAIEQGFDGPFVCADCSLKEADAAFER